MDIFDMIHEATKEANSFTNHPVKELSLEEQILYLNGIALVMNADGNIDENQKEYVRILIKSFELDESCLNDMVAFAQTPDKDTIQAFFRTFRRKPLAQLFLFDAYMMSLRDDELHEKEIAVVEKIGEQLEVLKGTQRDIFDLFCHIKNKDWKESSLYFSSHLLNPEHFKHLLDYYEVDFEELMESVKTLQQSRLVERFLSNGMPEWIPLKYHVDIHIDIAPEEKEITSYFVNLSFTYGMIIPFLQSLADRGEIRVFDNNVYLIKEDDNEALLLELEDSIKYDSLIRAFSVAQELEEEPCKGVKKELISHYFEYLQLGINIDAIAKGVERDYYMYFPKTINGKYLLNEIVLADNGNFYNNSKAGDSLYGGSDKGNFHNIFNAGDSLYGGSDKQNNRVDMDLVDILTSGRVRFTR